MPKEFLLLLIEYEPHESSMVQRCLYTLKSPDHHYHLTHANTLEEGVELLKKQAYDVIICDLFLPDSEGIKTYTTLHKFAQDRSIIVIASASQNTLGPEVIHLGAQDFLIKSEISTHLFTATIPFAVERQHLLENLRELSFKDELTHLYNRRGFLTLTEQHINLAKRLKRGFYLFFIDLDYLKEINDQFGHPQGDQALEDAAECIQSAFRAHDVIGRFGGDEFSVLALHTPKESGEQLMSHLTEKVLQQQAKKNRPYSLALSIGSAYYEPESDFSIDKLFELADKSLYIAKKKAHHQGHRH